MNFGVIELASQRVLESAMAKSRRGNFVKRYLYLLFPDSQGLLLELARRIGDEVKLPGEKLSLLAVCLREGAGNFYRRKANGRYNSSTWDQNVFLYFFQGVFWRASEIFDCRVLTLDGSCWEVTSLPYLDWRLQHPGEIEVCWPETRLEPGNPGAGKLCRLVLAGRDYRCTWAVRQLINLLEGKNVG
ncbi:MAG: hypothetical protein JRI66_03250 [Deltaproteobacteria bacterium]|nr:hypothetical protein [Deltaproteobacteria bacterium]